MQSLLVVPQAFEDLLQQHLGILKTDAKKYAHQLRTGDYELEFFAGELARMAEAEKQVRKLIANDTIELCPFVIQCKAFKQLLFEKVDELSQVLFTRVQRGIGKLSRRLQEQVDEILTVLEKEDILHIEELVGVRQYTKELPVTLRGVRHTREQIHKHFSLLDAYFCKPADDELQRANQALLRILELPVAEAECKQRLAELEAKFFAELQQMKEELATEIKESEADLAALKLFEALQHHDKATDCCDLLLEKLERCLENAEISNRRELLFKQSETDYSKLQRLKQDFEPYRLLWNTSHQYYYRILRLVHGPLSEVDPHQFGKDISLSEAELGLLAEAMQAEHPAVAKVAEELRAMFAVFLPQIPLVHALRSPYLKSRHWAKICRLDECLRDIEPSLQQSLEAVVAAGALGFVSEIVEISKTAEADKKREDELQA